MKIEQLRQMIELSKTKSLSRAAANLFISQPNLSTSIRALEEELSSKLVIRTNKGATLTVEGERFVEYAESIVVQFDRLKSLCKPLGNMDVPSFTLANMRFRFVVSAAAELYNQHSAAPFRLKLSEADRDGVMNLVAKGECEIGIISLMHCYKKELLRQLAGKDLQYFRLCANPVKILIGPNNPYFNAPPNTTLTIDMLKSIPQLRYQDADFGHFADKEEKLQLPRSAHDIIVNSRAAMVEMLTQTNAYFVAVSSEPVYTHASYYENIRTLDLCDKNLICELGWIKQKGVSPSALAMELIQILISYLE